ncbi:uncharacterized protein LOC117648187 [Thrips palmi]|uniref:Uncharacterized protein LOC117648187 n=1 Tax=Thrips palmi TaxID=161013 RepID=A0A6P8Z859_THRPL|nr:uncharacterized protein LOC117648187 [Thrips palmi]
MTGCSAVKCKNRTEDGVALFTITKTRRPEWLKILGLPESTPLQSRICEVHFEADQFQLDKSGRLTLKPGAVPTLFGSNLKHQLRQETVSTVTCSPITEDVWSCSHGTASIKYVGAQAVLRKHVMKDATNLQENLQPSRSLPSVNAEEILIENKNLLIEREELRRENKNLLIEREELRRRKAHLLMDVDCLSKLLRRLEENPSLLRQCL